VVDYPPEECEEFAAAMRAATGPDLPAGADLDRGTHPQVAKVGGGFSYYVSLKGVTGAGNIDTVDVANRLTAIRKHVKLPIGVGFGIRDGATARAVGRSGRRRGHRQPHHPGNRKRAARTARWQLPTPLSAIRQALDEQSAAASRPV
jgi:hypothetical protein